MRGKLGRSVRLPRRLGVAARLSVCLIALHLLPWLAIPSAAGIRVVEKGDRWLDLALRIQIQYRALDRDGSPSRDRLFFRRLRPTIMGTLTPDWIGKFQADFGGALDGNELVVKDAWVRYLGFKDRGLLLTLGNQTSPFSREFNSSSERQQLVERTFVGDPNWGANNRMLGAKLEGTYPAVSYKVSFGSAAIIPLADRLLFDTPVNGREDHNEGWLTATRLAVHPRGEVILAQDNLDRANRWQLAAGAYSWSGDGDNNTFTGADGRSTRDDRADVESAWGVEIDLAWRGAGFAIDAEYQRIGARAVDGAFSGGVYSLGEARLEKYALEGGYALLGQPLEVVGGYESQYANSYQSTWTPASMGLNYFIDEQRIKAQITYRLGENRHGVPGVGERDLFLQFQYVF